MNCPKCGGQTYIIDSRGIPEGVRRRRMCGRCHHRFSTYELECEKIKNQLNIIKKLKELLK